MKIRDIKFLIILTASLLAGCEECDPVRWQIEKVTPAGGALCDYIARPAGECLIGTRSLITFTDSCGLFIESNSYQRQAFDKYR